MKNKNKEQVKAIKTINTNIAVNAGAGTGKTKVLTDRYIEILENGSLPIGKEVESIVAITFTNKATQEMIERIRSLILEKSDGNNKWSRFYRDLEKANISTIHGFCGNILRENPIEAGIDPYFEILDDIQSNKILRESTFYVINKYLNMQSEKNELVMFLENQGLDRIDYLVDDFTKLYNDIRTYGINFNDIKKQSDEFLESIKYSKDDVNRIKEILEILITRFRKNSKLVKYSNTDDYINFINNNYEEGKDIYFYLEQISENLGKSSVEKDLQEELVGKIEKIMLSKEIEYKWMYDLVLDMLNDIDQIYKEEKRVLGYLDYDDLQILVLNLFNNKEILKKYQDRFLYFMIDEFQDTNELQKKIFYKLTSKNKPLDRKNLFVVGDPKQSIYRFRGADINVFYNVIEDIKKYYGEENIITLKTNYRSVDNVMNFVNDIFSKLMHKNYDPLVAFNKSKNRKNLDIGVILDNEFKENEFYTSHTEYEADLLAKKILKLRKEGYKYSDMAILLRSMTKVSEYEYFLNKYKIPYYNSSSRNYYQNQEIIDLISMLKFISNPLDILSFIGILRSNIFGFDDDLIFKIVSRINRYNLECIESLKEIDTADGSAKYTYDILIYLLEAKKHLNVVELVDLIIERTKFIPISMLKDNGEQISANIYKFKNITKDYYKEFQGSLEDYIYYLENIRQNIESDEPILSEKDNVVQIMTIHASKGLQFPIVFLPNMAARTVANNNRFIFSLNLGLNINNKVKNGKYDQSKELERIEELEELKRIYYVAMTRAEKKLYLGLQGANSGIKKEILSNCQIDESLILENFDIEKEEEEYFKSIKFFDNIIKSDNISFDLLYDIDMQEYKDDLVYSISQYMRYKSCPRKYYLDYKWKIKIDIKNIDGEEDNNEFQNEIDEYIDYQYKKTGIAADIKGNIVHDFCSTYKHGDNIDEVIYDSISRYINKNEDIAYKEVKPYIDNYILKFDDNADEIYSEKEFYIKLKNGYLFGIIDRINIKGDEIEVIDFKTNVLNKDVVYLEKLNNYYKPQLLTYAYVTEKLFDKKVVSSNIWYLYNNTIVDFNIENSHLREVIADIEKFIDFTRNNSQLDKYKPNKNECKNCEHNIFCEMLDNKGEIT